MKLILILAVLFVLGTMIYIGLQAEKEEQAKKQKEALNKKTTEVAEVVTKTAAVSKERPWDIVNQRAKIRIFAVEEDESYLSTLVEPVGKELTSDEYRTHVVEPILEFKGLLLKTLGGSTETFKAKMEADYERLVKNNAFITSRAAQLVASKPSTHEKKKQHTKGTLFDFRKHVALSASGKDPTFGQALLIQYGGGVEISEVSCIVLGIGGVYKVHAGHHGYEQSNTIFIRNAAISLAVLVYQRVVTKSVADADKLLDMPSITEEVLDKMQSIPMTNIPYYGRFYRAAGYQTVEVKLDNQTFVFSDSKGYLSETSSFKDVEKNTLTDELVRLRSERNPDLEKTDYGYVYKKDVAPVYWYV